MSEPHKPGRAGAEWLACAYPPDAPCHADVYSRVLIGSADLPAGVGQLVPTSELGGEAS